MSFTHILRYGTSQEQRFLQDFAETFDMVAINANMMAHARSAIASFITEKLVAKPFFIDPLTHAFQHGSATLVSKKTSDMKSSIRKLHEKYGAPTRDNGNAVLPDDFDQSTLRGFCERVLKFQDETVADESKEVQQYLEESDLPYELRPKFLIAPYFFMDENSYQQWLKINIDAIRLSKEQFPDREVWAQIVISKDILTNTTIIENIISSYLSASPSGILLWVDQFSEGQASVSELTSFKKFVEGFTPHHKVFNLYGGYWSFLLTRFSGLNGVAHGLEYGEERAVVPVGGGIPVSKFYYPSLHKRLKWSEAYNVLVHLGIIAGEEGPRPATDFYNQVCACPTCKEVIGADVQNFTKYGESKPVSFYRSGKLITMNYPLTETRDHCLRHYLWKKHQERIHMSDTSVNTDRLIEELSNAYNTMEFRRVIGLQGVGYLQRWIESLE